MGWLKDYLKPAQDPNSWPSFRLRGGPSDAKYVEIDPDVVARYRERAIPVIYYAPIQDGEVMYQESEEGVLQYVCVRFFD